MEYLTYDARGGILERESLRSENRNEDSFGQFRYRNYFGPQSLDTSNGIDSRRLPHCVILTKRGNTSMAISLVPVGYCDPMPIGKKITGPTAGQCSTIPNVTGSTLRHGTMLGGKQSRSEFSYGFIRVKEELTVLQRTPLQLTFRVRWVSNTTQRKTPTRRRS